jgi:6,7-dimethyl-8-ribityllumazine synthase
MKQNHFSETLDGKSLRIAIVASRFNADLTDALLADCLEALSSCGLDHKNIKTVRVPGSFELPVMAAELVEHEDYDAVVCLGIIIRGETSHDKYIAHSVSESLNHLAITTRVPMIFGVLTTEDRPQAEVRALGGGKKGWEAGMSAVEMGLLMREVRK